MELGNAINLTVNVTSTGYTPTGTVTIYEGNTAVIFNQALTNGTCTIQYTPTSKGTKTIYARYNGEIGVYATSDSETTSITVTKTPTIEILSPNIIYSYEPTIYKARVTYNGQPVTGGRVVFYVGGITVKNSAGTTQYISVDNNGYATLNVDTAYKGTTGTYVLKCVYHGLDFDRTEVTQDITVYKKANGITPTITWDIDETTYEVTAGNYHIQATLTRADEYPLQNATVQITLSQNGTTRWTRSNLTSDSNGEIDVTYPNALTAGQYELSLTANGTTLNGTTINSTTSTFNLTVNSPYRITLESTYQGGGLLTAGYDGLNITTRTYQNNQQTPMYVYLLAGTDPEDINHGGYQLASDLYTQNGMITQYYSNSDIINNSNIIPETVYIQAYHASTDTYSNILTIPIQLTPHTTIDLAIHDLEEDEYILVLTTSTQEAYVENASIELILITDTGNGEISLGIETTDNAGTTEFIIDSQTYSDALIMNDEITFYATIDDDITDELTLNINDIEEE